MPELTFVDKSTVKLVRVNGSDDDICHAAWVSNYGDNHKKKPWNEHSDEYADWEKQTNGLINFLYENRHMSPFEHTQMTFYIETPIFVTREFMRHRTWSYNEMSSRYTELPGRMFLIDGERPITQTGKIGAYKFEAGTDEQYGLVLAETSTAYIKAWQAYNNMLSAGIAKEVARNVLPVGIMTQFYATANLRNVMQFLDLRNDKHALKEIRDVAIQIEEQFAKKFPKVYKAYKAHDWREKGDEVKDLKAQVKALKKQLKEAEQAKYPLINPGILPFDDPFPGGPYRATFANEDVLEQPKG